MMINRQAGNVGSSSSSSDNNLTTNKTAPASSTRQDPDQNDDQNINTDILNSNSGGQKRQFLCGVVEGFYGKPWSCSQRKELLKRLREFNLNSFMYAPKDDAKHRAKWRQLYNEQEAQELKCLIEEANSNNIDFYYSLAPGLDIIYTDENDINLLCKKFDQLKSIGCKSFAILFDDIDPSINDEKDKVIFNDNYASAQVSITNLIYDHLGKPKFLFCPTEYCESRAVPNVLNSTYLNTIGVGLREGIDIMWSGCRVISRFITEESIEELSKVIRRPPVIWENLHANDYDKRRVFLGPYSGRSTRIIPKLRGVLTNPNCEYEANYIAVHTLAQWSKSTRDVNQHNRCDQGRQVSLLKSSLTNNTDLPISQYRPGQEMDIVTEDLVYDPDRALMRAIKDWLPHILTERTLPADVAVAVDQRSDLAASEQIAKEELTVNTNNINSGVKEIEIDEDTVNSVSTNKSEMDTSGSLPQINTVDTNSCDSCDMQDASELTTAPTTTNNDKNDHQRANQDAPFCVNCVMCSSILMNSSKNARDQYQSLNIDNLALLVDLFYLPFEHGLYGHTLLSDVKWLIDNSDLLMAYNNGKMNNQSSGAACGGECSNNKDYNEVKMRDDGDEKGHDGETGEQHQEQVGATSTQYSQTVNNDSISDDVSKNNIKLVESWFQRADGLNGLCERIRQIANTLIHDCPNKPIIAELYPYLVELKDLVIMLMDFIKFLRHRVSGLDRFYYSNSAASKQQKEPVFEDEQEPWVHRGGLIGDVHRLLP